MTDEAGRVPVNDIQVVARTAELLRLLTVEDCVDAGKAADVLGIGRSSAHRYLVSMERHGLVARRDRNTYEVGTLVTQLGAAALSRSGVIRVARPIMEALRNEIRQTITLALWNGDTAVVTQVVEDTSRTAHVSVQVGRALSGESAQAAVFRAYSDRTLFHGSPSVRRGSGEGFDSIRQSGVAVRDNTEDGISAVAVPIVDLSGTVVATLAAIGISQLMPKGVESSVSRALQAASSKITEALTGDKRAFIGKRENFI